MTEPLTTEPHADEEWSVLYDDSFDRDCPTSVEVSGRGLVTGLRELWARYLFETVQANGGRGFSRFSLRWSGGYLSAEAYWTGKWDGARRLRQWVFGDKSSSHRGYVAEADGALPAIIARAHAHLAREKDAASRIYDVAISAVDRADFERRLVDLCGS
jgi:hypothetical protein